MFDKLGKTAIAAIRNFHATSTCRWNIPKQAELDINYLCNPNNLSCIEKNIANRKGVGDIRLAQELKTRLDKTDASSNEYIELKEQLYHELLRIPNGTHPEVAELKEDPKVVKLVNKKPYEGFKYLEFHEIAKRLKVVRTEQLGNVCGNRSYYILGEMAELEHALVNYFLENLVVNHGFELVSVPDILPRDVIERCGMNTRGDRNQVYTLDPNLHGPDLCLSGTSEMALAGFLSGKVLKEEELPKKLAAVSRCFRAETSSVSEERGIYRVHEFTKVEMFLATIPDTSEKHLKEILTIQEKSFESLGLHFQVLDMPPHELGAPAYRKYDIEAWMPGRKMFGEISSCSDCTDYQSRRLGIKYVTKFGHKRFVHTLNGTACAIPRLLIALTETFQHEKGYINIPLVLHKYMRGKTTISKQKQIPELKLIKHKK
ncbi:unnamed protein product [Callosobruchus maculatus]|uniref:serine--tRNA ligase n=1 Tax=Callosobruchus maculatus TaxID=64391 RepID=A0A653D8I1_CALMS|nr:unnamed protein product [Callosobruchus maculatus]